MSKIYEALQQAELDRDRGVAPTQASGDAPAPVAPPVIAPPAVLSRASDLTATGLPVAPAEISPFADSINAAPKDAGPIDLAHIREVTWSPVLDQLPALNQRGASVEQFRSLRSRMQEYRDLNTLKSILVSSGIPQEGKSFIATNLAISFARDKAGRVLLIDGDMRRSSLHKLLGVPESPGLTEYLADKASLLEIMQRPKPSEESHPLPPGLTSLVFIPGGHATDRAADLSGNRRFERLLADVSPYFDWIVIDSSPVNLVSDGVNLARACDGVLLVARGGSTKFPVAQRAVAELKAAKVLGFVLNAVEDASTSEGYYGYDEYDKDAE